MRNYLRLLSVLLLTSGAVFGDAPSAIPPDLPPKILQDPKTKVVYYLESDRRHIAAITPDGKLLWCCEVVRASVERRVHIITFAFRDTDENIIDVVTNPVGPEYGTINKLSGVYTFRGSD